MLAVTINYKLERVSHTCADVICALSIPRFHQQQKFLHHDHLLHLMHQTIITVQKIV